MEYLVIIEPAVDGTFSAYVPDLPGCVGCGDSVEEFQGSIEEAIALHTGSLRRHGEPVPSPRASSVMIPV